MCDYRGRIASVCFTLALTGCSPEPSPEGPVPLVELPYVVFSVASDSALGSPVALGGDARACLGAPTPSEARLRVRVPPRALLTFAVGIKALTAKPPTGGRLRFRVRIGEDTPENVVFEREIHLARRGQWIDQSVDLRRYSGRLVWLSFETHLPGDGSDRQVVGLFADPVLHDRAHYREGRAIVVVSIDTLRRDHVSLYGYRRRTTPALEGLASTSVVFDDAVSTSSWTLPAHASLFTSLQPSAHGAVNLHTRLTDKLSSLPRLLQEHGFSTHAIVTHLYLSKEYGLDHGFDRHLYLTDTRAEQVTDRAIGFLEGYGDQDLFLFLHYYDPHWHYDPPAPYDRMFYPAYRGDASGIWWDFKENTRATMSPEDLRHIVALYDGEIRYTDRHLQRLLDAMKRLGMYDKSLVIVTSDHGEEFLEHGGWEHQKTLYEEQLRVPLLIKFPQGQGAGKRVVDQVSLIDVAPTILDALGLAQPASFRGTSLLPLTKDGLESVGVARIAWAETEHTLDGSHKVSMRRGSLGRKWIFSLLSGPYVSGVELYDLAEDPAERDNLARLGARAVEPAKERVVEFLREAEEWRRGVATTEPATLSPEQVDKLRSLGYVP